MRPHLSLHGITADDLRAGGGTKLGLYAPADGQIGFQIDGVQLYFDDVAEFAAWLDKLNALAAVTPCVVEAMTPATEPMPYYPAESFGVAMGCATGSVFDSCDGDRL